MQCEGNVFAPSPSKKILDWTKAKMCKNHSERGTDQRGLMHKLLTAFHDKTALEIWSPSICRSTLHVWNVVQRETWYTSMIKVCSMTVISSKRHLFFIGKFEFFVLYALRFNKMKMAGGNLTQIYLIFSGCGWHSILHLSVRHNTFRRTRENI